VCRPCHCLQAKQSRSVVYRHGTCTVNHRSPETAGSCRKPASTPMGELQDASPVSDSPLTGRPSAKKSAVVWAAPSLVVGTSPGWILSAGPIHWTPPRNLVPHRTSSSGTSAGTSLSDIVGQNAGGVEARLGGWGSPVGDCPRLLRYTNRFGSIKLNSGQHRPAPAAGSTATTAWSSTSRSDRRIPHR
jgi:hypothetical protein